MYNYKKGFALLYALLLSGAVLTIGVILMNIITKQLVFSSLNRESEITFYYLANSGRECLANAIKEDSFTEDSADGLDIIVKSEDVLVNCFGQTVTLNVSSDIFSTLLDIEGKRIDLEVQVNGTCINGDTPCSGSGLLGRYKYVATASGYSRNPASGGRIVKRTAIFVME